MLSGVESFQLVVPFEESDAARVAPNQPVEVRVDAVPGLSSPGTVLAVAPTGIESDGIVNYVATIVLTGTDPLLRDGQTGEAAVVVESVDGGAARAVGDGPQEGRAQRGEHAGRRRCGRPDTVHPPGAGDEYTEDVSGLTLGQEVLVPQAQVEASRPPGGPSR